MSSPHSSVLATSGSNTSVLSTQRAIPAISMKFNAEVSLNKKPNFGRYKFENSSIAFTSYMGTLQVGDVKVQAAIAPSSATKNTTVTVMTNLTAFHLKVPGQITLGVAGLRAYSKLRGKVFLVRSLIKKNRYAEMNFTFFVDLVDPSVSNIQCQ